MTGTILEARAREKLGHTAADSARVWLGLTLAGVAVLSGLRLLALFLTPLELYPDEAQYWLWSRHLALGYHSKPPMIAWLIALSTAVGGDAEAWVRLPALVLHAGAALALFKAGERLFDARSGAAAALLYSLAPGVQISSGAIATDAPLMFFLSLALWAYAVLWRAGSGPRRHAAAAALGLALGLAFLSKYAAVYFLGGLGLHAAIDPRARGLWKGPESAWAGGLLLLTLAPHLAWSAARGFPTLSHAVGNAAAQRRSGLLQLRGGLGFFTAQFAVFGPIPFATLVGGATVLLRRKALTAEDRLLLCLALPPLVVVLTVAVVERANANWAGVAYAAGAVLAGAWLVRWRARRALLAAALSQGAFAALFLAVAIEPGLADAAGLGRVLKSARGRRAEASLIEAEVERLRASGPVTAVAVDYRFDFNTLAYYDRALWSRPGSPPLRMWVRYSRPRNEAETEAPLTPAQGGRVLFVNHVADFAKEARADFRRVEAERRFSIPLDPRHRRPLALFVGRDFHPRPRDPVTGLPAPI